ncbi:MULTISPECIES: hypothetical protein [unclassified Endozoicomonas]|uniref:hypothetical protein n=1 Tax=unclassified Endozoicomonas TaxID=2644528 RepID=UPI003BB6668E
MDGRINEKRNTPFPGSEPPANRANQDVASNITEVSDVIPKLSPWPTPARMPDKTRTVSATVSATATTCSDSRLVSLPVEVFNRIASYLSINDINHFGQTSPTMGHRLRSCGLDEVHYFLSLTRQRQSSCRAIIQSSHLLLEYLRTLPIFSDRHFPAQLGPAYYSCYASHLRQQILDGAALTFIPIGSLDVHYHHHLRDHIPIIIERKSENYSDILAPDPDGQWVREAEIKHNDRVSYGHQWADHILFVLHRVPRGLMRRGPLSHQYTGKEHLLSVFERKKDSWVEQQLTTGDVFPQDENKYMNEMHLSPDASSLVCIHNGEAGAILGRGADGQWVNRGKINTGRNHHLLFSADNNHLLLYDGSYITLMSRAEDKSWSQTGDIVVTDPADDLKKTPSGETVSDFDFDLDVKFSPDNRHFVTWFEDAGDDSNLGAIERDYFFVVIFACDPQGQWHEKKRIIEYCDWPMRYFFIKPEFSQDGRLLIITSEKSFNIWELDTDDKWQLSYREESQGGGGDFYFSVDPCEFIRRSGRSVTIWRKAASGIWGETQTFPAEALVVASPSGETIVCNDPSGHTDLYQRKPFAESFGQPFSEPADVEWVNQRIGFSIVKADFNQEGCLLALVPSTCTQSLILFGLTADGSWVERTRLQTEGRIEKFCFSPCSRTLQVTSLRPTHDHVREQEVFSLWKIMHSRHSRE